MKKPSTPTSRPSFFDGKSLLNEALSPTAKQILQDFLDATDDPEDAALRRPPQPPTRLLSTSQTSDFVHIPCTDRPLDAMWTLANGEIVLNCFRNVHTPSSLASSGQIFPLDVLVAINDCMDYVTSIDRVVEMLQTAPLPLILTFRRFHYQQKTLGDYTIAMIRHELAIAPPCWVDMSVDDAAMLVFACIRVLQEEDNAELPLLQFARRVDQMVAPTVSIGAYAQRRDEVQLLTDLLHSYRHQQASSQQKQWEKQRKPTLQRKIEALTKQRQTIKKKLDQLAATHSLDPEHHDVWSEFVELRHLSMQFKSELEQSKRQFYLSGDPLIQLGSDGVYIGMDDLWIEHFHAKFTLETRSSAPHVFLHISTPAINGLSLRAMNFSLMTEAKLQPSFHCDELNVQAQLIAEVPFEFDAIDGWRVPSDQLHVKLMSLVYYERKTGRMERGKDHDTMMKLFINRLLPSLVKNAAQKWFCQELGPFLQRRNAQLMVSGELSIHGRDLALYDAPLFPLPSSEHEQRLADQARDLMGLSDDDAECLWMVLKSFEAMVRPKKDKPTKSDDPTNYLTIRRLMAYFDLFKHWPYLQVLAYALWQQWLQLVQRPGAISTSFAVIWKRLVVLMQYPVDITMSILDLTVRLELCEAAATYYTSAQRILRQKMDSLSIAVHHSNLELVKDGPAFLARQLAALDQLYDRISRILAYVTANVDEGGLILRGMMANGILHPSVVEAQDLVCKGPLNQTMDVPLTDLNRVPASSVDLSRRQDGSFTTWTHEHGALVFSKLFFPPQTDNQETVYRRLRVTMKNTSARVIMEIPTDQLTRSFVPLSFALDTQDDRPVIRFETSEFAKCQYQAERISVTGTIADLLRQSKNHQENDGASVWSEYLESPCFSVKFHFFTSCQVTKEHMFWSLKSASLSESKVAQVKHTISLRRLLQDAGLLKLPADQSQQDQRWRSWSGPATDQRPPLHSSLLPLSNQQTLFSYDSTADDRLSGSFTSGDYEEEDNEVETPAATHQTFNESRNLERPMSPHGPVQSPGPVCFQKQPSLFF